MFVPEPDDGDFDDDALLDDEDKDEDPKCWSTWKCCASQDEDVEAQVSNQKRRGNCCKCKGKMKITKFKCFL